MPTGLVQETWLLLVSFYGVIIAGAIPLAVAELTPLYALLAAFLCLAHALLIGPGGRPFLSDRACKVLSVLALLYALLESSFFDVHVTYSLGHFLVLVQVILLYGPHRLRDLRLIPVVALFELMVAGIWSLTLTYLPAFALSALAIMANSLAVDMHCDPGARRRPGHIGPVERPVGRHDFVAALWLPVLIVFAVTALVFPLLPRFRAAGAGVPGGRQWVTGFSENVSLREVGMLRQSDRVALHVKFFREDLSGEPMVRPPRILMRGASLPYYWGGQWFGYSRAMRLTERTPFAPDVVRSSYFSSQDVYELRHVDVPTQLILQKVTLEDNPGRVLFALYRPLEQKSGAPYELVRDKTSDELINPPRYINDNSYQVVSLVPTFSPEQLRRAGTPRPSPPWLAFWQVPPEMRPALRQTAEQIGATYHPATDYDRVVAAENFLLSGGNFTYTLEMPDYGDEDPIISFLTQTRRGSCEQFSSALALILRMWSIPTRLVVGYKGGMYEPGQQDYVFRDKDAHAWVEVYFNGLGWVEFDPTPGSAGPIERPLSAAVDIPGLVERVRKAASSLYYYANTHWGLHVIGYNRKQQRAVLRELEAAARGLAEDATSLLRSIWPGVPDLGFIQVALLVVGLTLVGIALYLAAGWLDKAIVRRRGARMARTIHFYEELLAIMRRKGLRRPPHQTPREFARAVVAHLSCGDGRVEEAVQLVTDLYYRARFGGYELDARQEEQMRAALRSLKSAPRPRRNAGG